MGQCIEDLRMYSFYQSPNLRMAMRIFVKLLCLNILLFLLVSQ
jgi:hypothetical protein